MCGKAPEVDFTNQRFGAILGSRVLHFLDGPDVDVTLNKMYRWLQPGGKLFLIVDTPYAGVLRKTVPQYLARKQRGEKWPGMVENYASYLPADWKDVDPPFIHLMDPDILVDACRRANFEIEHAAFMPRIAKLADADPLGRDHVGVICARPMSILAATVESANQEPLSR
jgi:SAM-dependent methyltransferase